MEPCKGGSLKRLAMVGVGDADQLRGPLPHVLAVEVGDAILCDDVMDVSAGGYDAGSFFQEWHDLALAASCC